MCELSQFSCLIFEKGEAPCAIERSDGTARNQNSLRIWRPVLWPLSYTPR